MSAVIKKLPAPYFRAFTLLALGLFPMALADPVMTVQDIKGRSIEIELISLSGSQVTFKKKDNAQSFTVALSQFDTASQEKISSEAKTLKVAYPKLSAEVSVGKRRRKDDSYYMVRQEITCNITLRNPNMTDSVPTSKAKIIFIGQDQRTPGVFRVLSAQEFSFDIPPGKTTAHETDAFATAYDSDNKGTGNIGGFQYYGYLLIIKDGTGRVVFNQSTAGLIKQACTTDAAIQEIAAYTEGTLLDDKMKTTKAAVSIYQ